MGPQRHHPWHALHAPPLQLPPVLHPQPGDQRPWVEERQGHSVGRRGARRGGAQGHGVHPPAARAARLRPQHAARHPRQGRRPHHAVPRVPRAALLHPARARHEPQGAQDAGRADEAEPQGRGGQAAPRGGGQEGARDQHPPLQAHPDQCREGVPRQGVSRRALPLPLRPRAGDRRFRPLLLLCRQRLPPPPPLPRHPRGGHLGHDPHLQGVGIDGEDHGIPLQQVPTRNPRP
mmetsp:Transcript_49557/g.123787  ORF Transcript_49557/g.123787 Transcript_49557/m.123787 type:complete len:233 (+) Transcript_49557:494-1192(+)